ncbi:helix-turn-helix transcriptional regulator [Streptomyces sp. DH37]|uniref:helix-turn-helix transcriptional regulator n=1 Tax=Streptomyces sp. DH37 TaxID=3040122 RepID=UPI00244257F5|nr:helix-turn-helix transcriptional regulator [Streptomyces sp. DH37]MDG9703731.1 helix-turn-helix transcriptional regulator [Streptomyces sp. DH37]
MRSFIFKGAAARERREELGLRAEEVAEAAGISRGHLLALERGQYEPSAPTYMRICEALKAQPEDLRERRATSAETPAADARSGTDEAA